MPLAILSCVPQSVRSILSSDELLNSLSGGHPDIGVRLVSHEDMRDTWTALADCDDHEAAPLFFHAALELSENWRKMPKASSAVLRANVEDIAVLAEKLAAALQAHEDEIRFHRGRLCFHDVLVRARTITDELAGKASPPNGWLYSAIDKFSHPLPAIPEFLRALAAELRPDDRSKVTVRPTKVSEASAERTYMVRDLSRFLNMALGSPRFDLVASTVNTILNDADARLDASHARKLASDLFLTTEG